MAPNGKIGVFGLASHEEDEPKPKIPKKGDSAMDGMSAILTPSASERAVARFLASNLLNSDVAFKYKLCKFEFTLR